jgi:hypothetical protein
LPIEVNIEKSEFFNQIVEEFASGDVTRLHKTRPQSIFSSEVLHVTLLVAAFVVLSIGVVAKHN